MTKRICVFGIVQGVGFRPFISRLAREHGIAGHVCNRGSYVEIVAGGEAAHIEAFQEDITKKAPPRSHIIGLTSIETNDIDTAGFSIIESTREEGRVFVSPDIGICDTCATELFDPENRRYLHPFINCTACGPRLTILRSMPYDRERTSMGEFPMCPACADEYEDPASRRYDAQPVCCNECGPDVTVMGTDIHGADAIKEARRVIADGKIIAVKGLGGFHLCCDGTREEVVTRLRRLKHRPVKPFAVMVKDLATAERECVVTNGARSLLTDYERPIVLLRRRPDAEAAITVAPGNPYVGIMLPYAPLQLLLFSYPDDTLVSDVLVMTSANQNGAPICRTDEEAATELAEMCDLILTHNRDILLRADDSVMALADDCPYAVRRSRGYAPLPIMVKGDFHGTVVGIGGELKNVFCLGKDNLFYLSPHIGDMSDVRTVAALRQTIGRMEDLLEIMPGLGACDLHPQYNTTIVAHEQNLPLLPVQHHYAHVLSCMAENSCTGPVIGVALDGTGYGTDGTIWGGEILVADYQAFTRYGSIMPFIHAGSDAAVRDGWRTALSLLFELYGHDALRKGVDIYKLCDYRHAAAQFFMLNSGVNCGISTSTGRLFDGVSALLGFCLSETFEGEAAMTLQFAAEAWVEAHGETDLPFDVSLREEPDIFRLATTDLVRSLLEWKAAGMSADEGAWLFHLALAELICKGAQEVRRRTGLEGVCLSGGVFQNLLLLRLCKCRLEEAHFHVYTHHFVPTNDGGIALGQAVAAMVLKNKGE
mgnify:FL=1